MFRILLASLLLAMSPGAALAADCLAMQKMHPDQAEIVTATQVSGDFEAPLSGTALAQDGFSIHVNNIRTAGPFCRLEIVSRPTADSFIQMEVWLPNHWNGKSLALSTGKALGAIDYAGMIDGVSRGYAVVSSDSGHRSSRLDVSWAVDHPEKITDFYYRADYVAAKTERAVTRAYYDRDASHNYFSGCARGGEAGLMMAQRHPELFDGIYAGSPGTDAPHQQAYFLWTAMALRDPRTTIPWPKFAMISKAVTAMCDGNDGLIDGQVTNPGRCRFDPVDIECKSGDGPDCLTAAQVATLRKIYAGPINPRTGEHLYDAVGAKGSELYWPPLYAGGQPAIAKSMGPLVYNDPNWDWTKFDFDKDMDRLIVSMKGFGDSGSDLRAYGRHGKIIITHGWIDPLFSPVQTLDYLKRSRALSGEDLDRFVKAFLLPGMGHCGGGSGPNSFDAISLLEQWVEKGRAPEQMIATKYVNDDPSKPVLRTRPICAYPKEARYLGSGDINSAANFGCRLPEGGRSAGETVGGTSKGS